MFCSLSLNKFELSDFEFGSAQLIKQEEFQDITSEKSNAISEFFIILHKKPHSGNKIQYLYQPIKVRK